MHVLQSCSEYIVYFFVFAGSADRIIKIFDLATGTLKLSLTGHISAVRGVIVSPRHPFLFSCGEDKQVKCWDLEYNKVSTDSVSL